jgi:hypothetical protein
MRLSVRLDREELCCNYERVRPKAWCHRECTLYIDAVSICMIPNASAAFTATRTSCPFDLKVPRPTLGTFTSSGVIMCTIWSFQMIC